MSTIIGLVSTFRLPLQEARGSPKGARKSCGMDFEAEGRHAEVQNASRCTKAEDQTSHL